MELRQLLTFQSIIQTGGFKKAAEELGYAQSSVTAHIKDLEKELNQPLFDRLGKNVILTQAGRRFLPYAEEIIDLYAASREAVNEPEEPSGPLIIGTSESLMIYKMPEWIMEFRNRYPNVGLTLKSIDYLHFSTQLKKGEFDVGVLVETSGWKPTDLKTYPLKTEKLSLVQTASGPAQSEQTMLLNEQACSWRPIFEEWIHANKAEDVTAIELPSIEAIKKCIMCGLGTSLLPHFCVEKEVESGKFIERKTSLPVNLLTIYAVVHKKKWQPASLTVFMDFIAEKLKH
ncbi:LysR family transcriptional regulator [Salibacterium aidingense]|uniref:LysR family transcriptional regulator n=1 Tax=Salibacterium aidingense TaxID=384933 RepID=UPI003BC6CD0C